MEEKNINTAETKPDTLITEENVETFKLLNMVSQMNDMKRLASDIKEKAKGPISGEGSDEFSDIIDTRVTGLTVDVVKKMSANEIYAIFTDENGKLFDFISLDDPKQDLEFKRDYLILRVECVEALRNLDQEIVNYEASMSEYEDEIKSITSQFDNITDYLTKYIANKRDEAQTPKEKEKYDNMLTAMSNALSLDNIKEFYKNPMNRRNLIPNFVMDKKSKTVFRKYESVRTKLKIKTNLAEYGNIEYRYLPEKYHERNNLFIFAVINMVASWSKNKDNLINGMFLSQFSVNLKNFIYDKFSTEKEKEIFYSAVCEILDMVM